MIARLMVNSQSSLVVASLDKMLHDEYISVWWNLASNKLTKSEAKFNQKTRKQRQLLSESGFVLRIAPPSLSRDKTIKMKKSIISNAFFSLMQFFCSLTTQNPVIFTCIKIVVAL